MKPLVVCAALVLASACRVGPEHEAPAMELPQAWGESASSGALESDASWWSAFRDPLLDTLIERAASSSLDVAIARARVREARALRDVASGGRAPTLDAAAGISRVDPSANGPQGRLTDDYDLFEAGFDARYEVDLVGRKERAVEAAAAGLDAAHEARRDALVTLAGEVAREYVELRGAQRQIAITRSNLALQEDTRNLTASRVDAGLATGLDLARANAQVASTQARVPAFEAQVRAGIHRLSVLLGGVPLALSDELSREASLPEAPRVGDLGVPADVVRRRPDVRRAERELARATALTAEATANLYPRLVLGASLGVQATKASDLFDADAVQSSVGGSLTAPIFNGGTLRANVRASEAARERALLEWRKSVLVALREVEDELSAVARERERLVSLERAVAANREAVELAEELQGNLADFFEVLDAQRTLLAAESELADSATRLSARTVALYKALGGGWDALEIIEEDVALGHRR